MIEVNIKIIKDENDIAQSIEYNLTGFSKNIWLGIYVNGNRFVKFRTNTVGKAIGILDTLPDSFNIPLKSLGNFNAKIKNPPTSGIIAGQTTVIEDSDNEGLDNVGTWSIDVRYDY